MKQTLVNVGLVTVLTGAAGAWGWSWLHSDLALRHGIPAQDLPPYGDELRRLEPYAESTSDPDPHRAATYNGPGWYVRRSPDGLHVAVTTSWGGPFAYSFLGLIIDRPFLHTVSVFDEASQRLTPVVSIKEADPASGIAHRYAWSQDSQALLIHGSGGLPEDYTAPVELCLVYLPRTDQLYRISNCPPLWQRGGRAQEAPGQHQ
jgi:hypothetical protein